MWARASLAEMAAPGGLVGGPFGSSLVGRDYVEAGVPVIRGSNMRGGAIGGEFVFVTQEKLSRDLSRNIAAPGDLIFTQRGTLGQVARVPRAPFGIYVVSQSQMRLRVHQEAASADFVFYACMTPDFNQQIDVNAIRTGVPHINLGILGGLRIPLPPLAEQRAIAEVLGALDDKIAANTVLIGTIGALMEALYKERATSAVTLTSLARFVNGRNFTKDASGDGRVVIRIAELNSGIGSSTVYNDVDAGDDNLAGPGDILFAWSGSLTVHRWTKPEGLVNQHIFKVVPEGSTPHWLAYQALLTRLPEFRAIAADKATTMGHIQRRHLEVDVPVPDAEGFREMDNLMRGLWDRSVAADIESQTLAELRDTLLPALMDGTIRVRDAAAAAEEALR